MTIDERVEIAIGKATLRAIIAETKLEQAQTEIAALKTRVPPQPETPS